MTLSSYFRYYPPISEYTFRFTLSTNYSSDFADLIAQAEAARLRGCSRQAIAKLVAQGRLKTYMVAGRKLVSRAEVIAFEPLPVGRKPEEN
jgi:excisionase family DNA binding protein